LVAALIPDSGSLPERPITVDQTHESVVVGERFVVKWLREPVPDHPAPVLLAHLAQVGFTGTPALQGALSGSDGLRALVTEYLPGASDGWEWCVDDLLAGEQGFPARLGALAAGLHAALATPSAVLPVPVTHADGAARAAWSASAAELLSELNDAWLLSRARQLRAALELPAEVAGTPLIRVHGDLHVGQILRAGNKLAVIDFDGNPAVQHEPMQAAARDVAQLMMSLEHVAAIAARRLVGLEPDPDLIVDITPGHRPDISGFVPKARADFLSAYRNVLAEHGMSHLLDERLIPAFEIEQELRELRYASQFLPRWRYAPMAALRRRFP
jgi:maltokinase